MQIPKTIELLQVHDIAYYPPNAMRSIERATDWLMREPTHFEVIIDGHSAIKNRACYEADVYVETWSFIFGIEYALKTLLGIEEFPKVTERQIVINSNLPR